MPGQLSLFKGKRQRGVKPPTAKEYATHCMVADILRRLASPGWQWTHFPAGEYRLPATTQRLKRMGVARGWPDFILLSPLIDGAGIWSGRAHFLELKREGSKLTPEQSDFAVWCDTNGYPFFWCDNFQRAIETLKQWGAVRASVSV